MRTVVRGSLVLSVACLSAAASSPGGGASAPAGERADAPVAWDGDLGLDAALAEEPTGAAQQDPSDFRAYWKNGLRLETLDKRVKLTFGGRFHNDWTWQRVADDPGDIGSVAAFDDGTQFRRARIEMGGQFDGWIDWYAAYDFGNGGVAEFRDAYLGYRRPGYRLRLGQFKQPFGLEWQASSNAITFMERGSLNQTVVRRGTGIMVHNDEKAESCTWALGWFREGDQQSLDESVGEYAITGRVTGTPVFENGGERVVHVGGAASFRGSDELAVRLQFEQGLADPSIDTGATPLDVDDGLLFGFEAAWLEGPWSVQGEVIQQTFDARVGPDPDELAWYVFVSRFLTSGDRRKYDRAWGRFSEVTPKRPLGQDGGKGAVELALRYSSTRLDDVATLPAGSDGLEALTLGLNWYQNYNTRIMFNLLAGQQEELDGNYYAFGVRLQLFF